MNFGRMLRLFYLGAILLPGMISFSTSIQKKSQVAHPPATCPADTNRLSADGGAPPPPVIPKKPTNFLAA
jgi:hypothetical protein